MMFNKKLHLIITAQDINYWHTKLLENPVPNRKNVLNFVYDELHDKGRPVEELGDSLQEIDMKGVNPETLRDMDFSQMAPYLKGKSFTQEQLPIIIEKSKGTADNSPTMHLDGLDLSNMDFSNADLNGVIFTNCNLKGANFSGCVSLQNITFAGNTNLKGANFSGKTLDNVRFGVDKSCRTNLSEADFSNTIFINSRFAAKTTLPNVKNFTGCSMNVVDALENPGSLVGKALRKSLATPI